MSDTLNLFPSEGITQASEIAAAGAAAKDAPGTTAATPSVTTPPAAITPPSATEASALPAVTPTGTPPAGTSPATTPPPSKPSTTAEAVKEEQQPATPVVPPEGTPAAPASAAPGAAEQTGQQTPEELTAAVQRKLLEDLGVESLDDLKARLTPPAQLTPEQIKKQNDLHKANLQSYAVQKLGMTVEEFARADQMAQQDNENIVFGEFKKAWIAENQGNAAYKGKNLEEEARYVFEQYYHINSDNETIREMGQRGLELAAQHFKNAATARITEASNSYNTFRKDQEDFQKFDGFLQKALPDLVPKILSYEAVVNDKGDKVKFDYALDPATAVPEIMKALKTDFNFDLYRTKGIKEALPVLQAQVSNYLRVHNHEKAIQAALSTGVSHGLQMGKVGPNAPFPISPAAPVQGVQDGQLSPADIDKVAQVIGSGGY